MVRLKSLPEKSLYFVDYSDPSVVFWFFGQAPSSSKSSAFNNTKVPKGPANGVNGSHQQHSTKQNGTSTNGNNHVHVDSTNNNSSSKRAGKVQLPNNTNNNSTPNSSSSSTTHVTQSTPSSNHNTQAQTNHQPSDSTSTKVKFDLEEDTKISFRITKPKNL
jgi:hypothetical protein